MENANARLWLVRHGQTDWNSQGRAQGHTPTELNEVGRGQAAELAAFFRQIVGAGKRFGALWSSDLPRAYQTAEAIAGALGGMAVEKSEALRERSFGTFEGATVEELRGIRAGLGLPATGDLTDWTGMPGIESAEVLWKRVAEKLKEIAIKHRGEDVVVVTHGGVVARAVNHILGLEEGHARRYSLANGIIAVVEWRMEESLEGEGKGFYLLSLVDVGLLKGGATGDTSRG